MQCLECGFELDEVNESQPVCPRCGADSRDNVSPLLNPKFLFSGITAQETMEAARPDPAITPGNDLPNGCLMPCRIRR
jgi:hypothetical protein